MSYILNFSVEYTGPDFLPATIEITENIPDFNQIEIYFSVVEEGANIENRTYVLTSPMFPGNILHASPNMYVVENKANYINYALPQRIENDIRIGLEVTGDQTAINSIVRVTMIFKLVD